MSARTDARLRASERARASEATCSTSASLCSPTSSTVHTPSAADAASNIRSRDALNTHVVCAQPYTTAQMMAEHGSPEPEAVAVDRVHGKEHQDLSRTQLGSPEFGSQGPGGAAFRVVSSSQGAELCPSRFSAVFGSDGQMGNDCTCCMRFLSRVLGWWARFQDPADSDFQEVRLRPVRISIIRAARTNRGSASRCKDMPRRISQGPAPRGQRRIDRPGSAAAAAEVCEGNSNNSNNIHNFINHT